MCLGEGRHLFGQHLPFTFIFTYVHMCVLCVGGYVHMSSAHGTEEDTGAPGAGITGVGEQNSGPLGEQYMLITTEP